MRKRRILAFLMTFLMVFTLMSPATAYADGDKGDTTEKTSEQSSENVQKGGTREIPSQHTLTFYLDEGKTEVYTSIKAYGGEEINAPENPTKIGSAFSGWDQAVPDTMPNEDMDFTAQWTDAVAKIGDAYFATLSAAIAATESGDAIVLLADVSDALQIAADKELTLDLNGKTLTVTDDGTSYSYIRGDLTIEDSGDSGKVVVGNDGIAPRGESGTLTVNGGAFSTEGDYLFYLMGGELEINDGTFSSGYNIINGYADGAYALGGITTINGGTFVLNPSDAEYPGGIVFGFENSDIMISGGTFTANDGSYAFYVGKGSLNNSVEANSAVMTVNGGTFIGVIGAGDGASLTITGGNFIGEFDDESEGIAISGGTFSVPVAEEYCAEGYIPKDNGDGTYTVKSGAYVAQVGDTKFETFAEAVAARASNDDVITLLGNVSDTYALAADETLKIAANGKTITVAAPEGEYILKSSTENGVTTYYVIDAAVKNGNAYYETLAEAIADAENGDAIVLLADVSDALQIAADKELTLDLNGKTLTVTNDGTYYSYIKGELTIEDSGNTGKVVVDNYGIAPSGDYGTLIVNGGAFSTNGDYLFYLMGGELEVNDGTFNGVYNIINGYADGAYALGGTTTINGGTFVLNPSDAEYPGGIVFGFENSDITINGGTFTANDGAYAFYVGDGSLNDGVAADEATLTINGGTFKGLAGANDGASLVITDGDFDVEFDDDSEGIAISGGTFVAPVAEDYCAEGYIPKDNGDGTYTVKTGAYVAQVGDAKFETFAEAVAARASSNDVITLLAKITDAYVMASDDTLKVAKNGFTVTVNVDGPYVVTTSAADGVTTYSVVDALIEYTATNGTKKYYATASNTFVSGSGTYKLLGNVSMSVRLVPGVMASEVVLDLNGYTFTSTATDYAVLLSRHGSASSHKTFSIVDSSANKGGTFVVNSNAEAAIQVTGKYNDITIGEGVTIDGGCVAVVSENQTVDIYGTVNGGNDFALATNGSLTKSATITIHESAILTSDGVAVYLPGDAAVEINGVVIGTTAVYVKSGTLNIDGAVLIGIGAAADYTYNGNGCNATGDALVVDNCGYPAGAPTVVVADSTITSDNAKAIGSYIYGDRELADVYSDDNTYTIEDDQLWIVDDTYGYKISKAFTVTFKQNEDDTNQVVVNVAVGTEVEKPEDPKQEGYVFLNWTKNDEEYDFTTPVTENIVLTASWTEAVAGIGEDMYITFAEAAAARTSNDDVIKLYAKVTDAYVMAVDETLKVAKNGKSITVKVDGPYVVSSSTEGDVTTYTVTDALIEYTTTAGVKSYSATLPSAFSSGTYKLLGDVTRTQRMTPGTFGSNVTLDLNGYTLTSTASDYAILLGRDGSASSHKTFAIVDTSPAKGGTLVVNPSAGAAIQAQGKYNDIVIGEGVTIDGGCVAVLSENQTVDIYGTVNGGNDFALATNGNLTKSATIKIFDGAVLTSNNTAVYLPGDADVEINGTVTGTTAVYVKSGTLYINGATLKGTGAAADYTYNGNGCNATGDALVVDNCGYPGGAPTVVVADSTITSDNAKAIGSYIYGDRELADVYSDVNTYTIEDDQLWVVDDTYGYKISKAFTVTFESNNGEDAVEVKVPAGTAVAKPENPTNGDLFFAGWFLDDAEYDFAESVNADITLNAQWRSREWNVIDIVPEDKGTFDAAEKTLTFSDLTLEWAALEGNGEGYWLTWTFVAPDAITAATIENYRIDYGTGWVNLDTVQDGTNESGYYIVNVPFNVDVNLLKTKAAAQETYTKEYKFGWVDEIGNDVYETITLVIVPENLEVIRNDARVYKIQDWKLVHTVTFDSMGGATYEPVEVKDGEVVTEPDTIPTKANFVFAGWYLGDDEYDFETAVTGDITLTATWTEAVASVTIGSETAYYDTLKAAVEAIGSTGTITLLKDINLAADPLTSGGYANVAPDGKNVTLNLNGKNINGGALDVYGELTINGEGTVTAGTKHGVYVNENGILTVNGGVITGGTGCGIVVESSELTITGGTIQNSENGGMAVYVYDGKLTMTGGEVRGLKDDTEGIQLDGASEATVSGGTVYGHDWGITVFGTSELTVSGTAVIETSEEEGYAISTNGNEGQNPSITINGGTITGAEVGIYQPSGTVTITGGTISGTTAIYQKTGVLDISGTPVIIGTGEPKVYEYNGNGSNPTGDAIVVDSCEYPNGTPTLSISGNPEITSSKGLQIGYYEYDKNGDGEIEPGVVTSTVNTLTIPNEYKWAEQQEGNYLLVAKVYVAAIGDAKYETLAEALAAAKDGSVVTLLDDYDLSAEDNDARAYANGKHFYLNLNDKTLTGRFTVTAGEVNVMNGTLVGRLDAYDEAILTLAGAAKVEGQIVVWGEGTYGEAGCKTPKLNVFGTVENSGDSAITTNGTDKSHAIINIYRTAVVTSTDDIAIYLPSGNVNIAGGTITGTTAVYIKSGELAISGGTLHATGAAADYEYNGNGGDATGDALVVENCNYPNGAPTVTITGGEFVSDDAKQVAAYKKAGVEDIAAVTAKDNTITVPENEMWIVDGEGYKLVETVIVTFNPDNGDEVTKVTVVKDNAVAEPTDPVKANYVFSRWTLNGADYDFDTPVTEDIELIAEWTDAVAKIGDTYYVTLAEAFAAAEAGDTIVVIADTEAEEIEVSKKITLDLNGKTVSTSKPEVFAVKEGGDLTITGNGTVNGPANGETFDGKALISVVGKLTIENGTFTATGEGSDGMYGVYVLAGGTAVFGKEGEDGGPTITSHFAAIGENHMTAPAYITVYGGTYTANAAPTNNEWWSYFCAAVYAPGSGTIDLLGGTFNGYYGISDRYADVEQTLTIGDVTFNTISGIDVFVDDKNGSNSTADRLIISDSDAVTVPEGYQWVAEDDHFILKNLWTVTFNSDGGSDVEEAKVVDGETVEEPEKPTKENFVFDGWYLGNEPYDFETEVTGDIELTAKWTEAVAKIDDKYYRTLEDAFDDAENGETIEVLADTTLERDINVNKEIVLDLGGKTVDRDVYELIYVVEDGDLTITGNGTINGAEDGAYYDGTAVIVVDGGKLTFVNGTLNATGEGSDGMYGVYVYNNGTAVFGTEDGEGPTITAHFGAICGNPEEVANITVYGGVYTANATPTEDDWWSYYCAAAYAAGSGEFNLVGGTFNGYYGISDRCADVEQTLTIGNVTINATSGIDMFVDDQIVSHGTANRSIISISDAVTVPEGYQWVAEDDHFILKNLWTVTFNTDGGSEVDEAKVLDGETVEEPEDPTKDNFVFAGWYLGDDLYDFSTEVTGDIELTAHWTEAVASVTNADNEVVYYLTLPEAVAAAQNGDTVTLLKSTNGNGVMIKAANAKDITIDLGGNTYTVGGDAVGSAGTQTQVFHFEKGCNILLKNGTLVGDESAAMLLQNYCNLTLEDITLDGSVLSGAAPYTLSNNNGTVVIGNGTTIIAKDGGFAFDVCVTNRYPDGAQVTVEDGAVIVGNIEYGVWGTIPATNNATLTINGGTFEGTFVIDERLAEAAAENINVYDGEYAVSVDPKLMAEGKLCTTTLKNDNGYYYIVDAIAVTFDPNGGAFDESEEPVTILVPAGESVTDAVAEKPEDPSLEGYSFAGWLDGENEYTFTEAVTEETVLTADWQIKKYVVTFELVDGEYEGDDYVAKDGKIVVGDVEHFTTFAQIKPANDPTRHGYIFKGWQIDAETMAEDDTEITDDIEFYATWEGIDEFVIFTDGMGNVIKRTTIKFGEELTAEEYANLAPVLTEEDIEELIAAKAAADGGKWTLLEDNLWTPVLPADDTTITQTSVYILNWIKVYTVTFRYENGDEETTEDVLDGNTVAQPDGEFKLENYDFGGWFIGNNEYDFDTPVTADITLTAHWNALLKQVTFDSDGGSEVDMEEVPYGSAAKKPADPEREGYTFLGWFFGDDAYDFETAVTDNIELTAHWASTDWELDLPYTEGGTLTEEGAIFEYVTLTFSLADPSIGRTIDAYWIGFKFIAPEAVTADNIANTIYSNDGGKTWKYYKNAYDGTEADGRYYMQAWVPMTVESVEELVEAGETRTWTYLFAWNGDKNNVQKFVIEVDPSNIELVKNEETDPQILIVDGEIIDKNEYFEVTFDANGGDEVPAQNVRYRAYVEVPETEYEGHSFEGWYLGDEEFDFSTEITEAIELTAHWTAETIDVVFDSDGGSDVDQAQVEYGKTVEKPEDPVREGYAFIGWFLGDEAYDFATAVTERIVLTAHWTDTSWTLTLPYTEGTLTEDGAKFENLTLTFSEEDASIGRQAGYYVGMRFTAPEVLTAESISKALVSLDGGNSWMLFKKVNDGTDESGNYILNIWARITEEEAESLAALQKSKTWNFQFVWDGDTDNAQAFVIEVSPENIKLVKNDEATDPQIEIVDWEIVSKNENFTVTFNTKGGEEVGSQTVRYNNKVVKPDDPNWTGYEFEGWYLDETLYDFTTPVTADITLEAKWAKLYSVTFIDDDGTVLKEAQMYPEGTTVADIETPEEPTKEGNAQYSYVFNGWDPELEAVSGDAVYRATYRRETNQYTVTFKDEDGTEINSKKYDYGTPAEEIELPDTDKNYAEFQGWYLDGIQYNFARETITEDVELTAQYKVSRLVDYAVVFDSQMQLRYRFDLLESVLESGGYIVMKRGDTVIRTPISEYKYTDADADYQRYYLDVFAPEFADDVTLTIEDASGNLIPFSKKDIDCTNGFVSSVKTYAETLMVSGRTQKSKDLGKALYDYGTAAQIHFKYGDYANLTVSDEVMAVTAENIREALEITDETGVVRTGTLPGGISKTIATIYFNADNDLIVRYYTKQDLSNYKIYVDGIEAKNVEVKNGLIQVVVTGVHAPLLANDHVVTITDGTDTHTTLISGVRYALGTIESSTTSESMKNLSKALYLYYVAAKAYFE